MEGIIKDAESGKGPAIVKVYASADSFLAFCRTAKVNPDSKGRSLFAAVLHRDSDKTKN